MKIREAVVLRIINLCHKKGITINKLSKEAGISHSTLNNIISSRQINPTINTVQKICDGLEIKIKDFYNDVIFETIEQEIE